MPSIIILGNAKLQIICYNQFIVLYCYMMVGKVRVKEMEILNNIVLMAYGTHAGEGPDCIISRKKNELIKTGRVFWGYNGTLCHPINQIQPFLQENIENDQQTYLALVQTQTYLEQHNVVNVINNRAILYSEDRIDWLPIPSGNNVIGSKYAVICSSFEKCNIAVDLSQYRMMYGTYAGKRASDFWGWRKNKACCRYSDVDIDIATPKIVTISVLAKIEKAVFIQ